jgi:cation:H+ antiporter
MTSWALFLASAAAVVAAGTRLTRFGDRIAHHSGLGGLWIGVVLLAAATSLPEVFTAGSSALLGQPDLAAGNLFGACMANMLILAIVDHLHRGKPVWRQATFEHAMSASLATVLMALASFFVLLDAGVAIAWIGLDSMLLLALWALGMRVVFRQDELRRRERLQERIVAGEKHDRAGDRAALRRAVAGFGAAALVLLAAAPILAWSAADVAERTGISTSFVGTSLLAFATTLPEFVSALAAVRLGAYDLALGNLFGSNAFNMAAFFFVDLAYREGPVLAAVGSVHALAAFWGIVLVNVASMGIVYRAEQRLWLLEPDSGAIIASYALGLWLLFG